MSREPLSPKVPETIRRSTLWSALFSSVVAFSLGPAAHAYDCNVHVSRPGGSYLQICDAQTVPAWDSPGPPVCVCDNDSTIITTGSDGGSCPTGYSEVGRCKSLQYYPRTCSSCSGSTCPLPNSCPGGCGPTGKFCPRHFITFVPTPAQCEACGHDVRSAVEACWGLCERYFHRWFDETVSPNGAWKPGTHPSLGLDTYPLSNGTGLAQCRRVCGPPSDTDPSPAWGTTHDNHWRYVTFGRHNPNSDLHGWLRSYAVNADGHDEPRIKCRQVIEQYCNAVTVGSAKAQECKKAPLLSGDPHPFDFDGDANGTEKLFCDHFFRGNFMCPDSCFHFEAYNALCVPRHMCGGDLCDGQQGMLGGSTCNAVTATCNGGSPLAYNVAKLINPEPASTCGTPTVVTTATASVVATYKNPAETTVIPPEQVAAATWQNETTGTSGTLAYVAASAFWYSEVPLATGQNRVKVRFTDLGFRVSGDAMLITKP